MTQLSWMSAAASGSSRAGSLPQRSTITGFAVDAKPVGASLLAKDVNDDAAILDVRDGLRFFSLASQLLQGGDHRVRGRRKPL